ncbi:MAG: response regulator [Deltaproteobacteria bacterium]|jgi:response regulator of citrate/malate metabolism|nr:response regulator [Deltaproteobacteria bacterium]
MNDGLDVIIVDDDLRICKTVSELVKKFYVWGDVLAFSDIEEGKAYCLKHASGIAIFVLDVFLGNGTGFTFLESIAERFPTAYEDTIIITGNASEDVVNMCVASDVYYLLEKPVRSYALQFAIRAIVTKYIRFAQRILVDPSFAQSVDQLGIDSFR